VGRHFARFAAVRQRRMSRLRRMVRTTETTIIVTIGM
jgi:hypothetical protein